MNLSLSILSKAITGLAAAAAVVLLVSCESGEKRSDSQVTITFITDSVGKQLEITRAMVEEFTADTGISVSFQIGPNSATERLAEYQKFFGARSPHADVYQIDVIWPGILAPHLLDLSDTVDTADFFPAMIDNNTVDGRLVCVPFYADAGLLYYRTDLIQKYGFDGPPETMDELESMARTIMEGEREGGNEVFYGYVFQGASYEGLTCNALEWQASAGGGTILTPDGNLEVDNKATRDVMARVAKWIGVIAPRGVLTYMEEESRSLFQSGNAAFMRNWPYAYQLGQDEESPIRGKFNVAPLPGAEKSAATLGGWNLGVSRYSKHPEEAKQFVAFLSTRRAQLRRALEGGYFATRPDVYGDPSLDEKTPYYNQMEDVFLNAVVRPSTPAGQKYNEVSAAYYRSIHGILSGDLKPEEGLERAANKIRQIMER